jgi:ATP-dependent DNA helicase RecG
MDLLKISGIGPKKKEYLRRLSIYSVSDLYNYYPREYEDRSKKMILKNARDGVKYYFQRKIISKLFQVRTKNHFISYLYASDGKDKVKIIRFNDRFSPRKLVFGKEYRFFAKVEKKDGFYETFNPVFSSLDDDSEIGGIISIYPLTKSITRKQLSGFIEDSLKYYDEKENLLDKEILEKFSMNDRLSNLKNIHFPKDISSLKRSKSEIKIIDFLKELYFLNLIKNQDRKKNSIKLEYDLEKILKKLDFELTFSQKKSLEEILEDAKSNQAMNRLLCGDVGSGKTIIALILMIIYGINSYQSAMMVPTEVLAIQQYEKNKDFIESFGLKVGLLTSSVKNKDEVKEKIKKKEYDLIIGTHALIQDDVIFDNLKLIVNDEQHRFGVMQRQKLAEKGINPDYLTMTATPIPRTLYLKLSDLLDISIIGELPKSRLPIDTEIVSKNMEESLFQILEENLDQKRQVYVVTNNIDSDDENSLENLYKRYKKRFSNKKIKRLHGKLKPEEKETILKDFSNGNIDILISTTVIEVGIDVKNANVMVIYNAQRFGLSTLHQLRGRVGRGPYKSFCYLISKDPMENKKLDILAKNNNGFDIARLDLELRGGGKILSTIQHGKNLNDLEYLNMSKEEIDRAFEIFSYTKDHSFQGVNLAYIEEYFNMNKRIILN